MDATLVDKSMSVYSLFLLAVNEINERPTEPERSSLESGSQHPNVACPGAFAADGWRLLVRDAQQYHLKQGC